MSYKERLRFTLQKLFQLPLEAYSRLSQHSLFFSRLYLLLLNPNSFASQSHEDSHVSHRHQVSQHGRTRTTVARDTGSRKTARDACGTRFVWEEEHKRAITAEGVSIRTHKAHVEMKTKTKTKTTTMTPTVTARYPRQPAPEPATTPHRPERRGQSPDQALQLLGEISCGVR